MAIINSTSTPTEDTAPIQADSTDGSGDSTLMASDGGPEQTLITSDGGGGGGGTTTTYYPPTVTLAVSSASQAEAWVRPGVNATINVSGTITVSPNSTLSSYSSTVTVNVNGASANATVSGTSWSAQVSMPTGSLTGSTNLTVSASSSTSYTYLSSTAGGGTVSKSASGSVAVRIDKTAPVVTAAGAGAYNELPCPLPGNPVSVTLTGTVGDGEAGVDKVWVGTDVNNLAGAAPGAGGQWSRTVLLPATLGKKTVYVKATDTVGNLSAATIVEYTLVDKTPPEVTVDAISRLVYDDAPLPLTVRGTCYDVHTGVSTVQVILKTAAGTTIGSPINAALTNAGAGQRGTWSAALTIPAAGAYRVHVTATDLAAISCPTVTADIYADAIPEPVIDITSHAGGEVIPGGDEGVDIVVRGVASATLTQLTKVEVSVGGGAFVTATNESGDWTRWSAGVHLSADGEQDVVARATTAAHNPQVKTKTDTVRLSVGVRYTARDQQDNTSLLAYFLDLLRFATRRVKITEGAAVRMLSKTELAAQFYQPFDRLAFDEEVSQARLCVEALR
ncbi:MAG TPA: hypothetical protein VF771_18715, partial [Longimicrobiaceae bacterium]